LKRLVDGQNRQAQASQGEVARYANQSRPDSMLMPNGQNPTMQELSSTRTVVFVSRSIPEHSLLGLLKQGAGRKDVVFAFRGWGEGSVNDMFAYSQALIKKLPVAVQKNPPQIIVMPQAFSAYKIHYAPAVLHRDNDGKWYLVQGMRSLDAAIGSIRARKFNERLSQQYRVSEPDQAEVMRRQMQQQDMRQHIRSAQQGAQQLLEGGINLPTNTGYRQYRYTPYVAAGADIRHPGNGTVLYPKGTRFNVLALDPHGQRALVVIDGRSRWQIEFARHLMKKKPDTLVLYTRLGYLRDAGLPASPLDGAMKSRLNVAGVPTYYRQNGLSFDVVALQPEETK
jgi:hypothetical protein